jgi:hypothetical protein
LFRVVFLESAGGLEDPLARLGLTSLFGFFDRGGIDMPASVRIAIAAIGALFATNFGLLALVLASGLVSPLLILNLGVTGLVLWGLLRRHRLAWQWGRVLSLFSAIVTTLAMVVDLLVDEIAIASGWLYWLLVFQVVCLYLTFVALGRSSAFEHFDLICPECSKPTKKAANFWFTRARCRACGHTW